MISGAVYREGVAYTADGAVYVQHTDGATQANPTFTGTGGSGYIIPVARSAIPIISASSGSMGNNGALSALTALPLTYASAYIILPAGAIAAGVPAATDIYYVVMSSTTAGTVYNNRLADNLDASGNPTIPASPTAFATVGPGAFTGVTGAVTCITLTLSAGVMGTTGEFTGEVDLQFTNNANAKALNWTFGGTNIYAASQASVAYSRVLGSVSNRGSASVQAIRGVALALSVANNAALGSINTANAVNVVFQLNKVTATDNIVLERYATYLAK